MLRSSQNGSDDRVGAYVRALVALNAVFGDPYGYVYGGAALFVLGGSDGNGAVRVKCGYRQLVAFLLQNGVDDLLEVFVVGRFYHRSAFGSRCPGFGIFDFYQLCDSSVDCGIVHVDDCVALLAVGLFDSGFHILFGVFVRNDVAKFKERCLHDGVDALCRADGFDNFVTVQGVETNVLLCDGVFDGSGQFLVHFFRSPDAVQQEDAAFFQIGQHIVTEQVAGGVASDKVGRVDQITGLNGLVAEPKVRNGDAARLFRIVHKVTLSVLVGVVADNFDAVLVGADGTVRAQAVELAANGACGSGVDEFVQGQVVAGDVVDDTDGEAVFVGSAHVLIDGVDHGGVEFLAAQTVSAAQDDRVGLAFQSGYDVQVQRFAQGTGFFRPVHNGNVFCRLRNDCGKCVRVEGTIQTNLYQTDFLSQVGQVIYGFFACVGAGTHNDDDLFGVGRAYVIKQMIASAGQRGNFVHVLLDDAGNGCVVFVCGFPVLEVNVAVLRGTLLNGVFGVQSARSEIVDIFHVDQFLHVFVIDGVDLADLVRGTESVKEVDERNFCLQRGQVSDQRKVHSFLNGTGRQHCKTGLTASHNVGVIAENVQSVRRQSSGGNVEDAGQQFARDLVHIRDHQQQSLAGGVSRRQRACAKGAVNGACRTRFGLHLRDL